MCLTLYIFARLSINKFYIQISFHVVFPMFWFFFYHVSKWIMLQVHCTLRINREFQVHTF